MPGVIADVTMLVICHLSRLECEGKNSLLFLVDKW
jgi:hypothetical protein